MANKLDPSKLKVGDRISETQYYEIKSVSASTIGVKNERGFEFIMGSSIAAEGSYSANQFDEVIEVNRTELIEIFSRLGDTVFTVNYHKMPKSEEINEAIESANKGKILPIKDIKKLVKNAYKGEERTLVGYLIKVETGFGRSIVIDLEADSSKSTSDWDSRIRQVDHRTLNWLIYQNKKYQVKK